MFDVVHRVTDWYDGPRRGIADYQGVPHLFESKWDDGADVDAETFLLMPIDSITFSLALEHWTIWLQWESAFHQGLTTPETHPALPKDRERHEELQRLLEERLRINSSRAVRKRALFQATSGPVDPRVGLKPLEVQWKDA